MSDQPGPSRLRVVLRELAILAVGLIMLFVVLGLIVYFGAPVIGLKMCCQ
ncbi:MAG: hypothetical protein ACJ779_01065 [Chloroflexota bacterium]